MRFIIFSKIVFYTMSVIVIVTVLNNIIILRDIHKRNIISYKYILLWTRPNTIPFVYLGEGQSGFLSRNCQYINCIVTANRSLLTNYTLFDVIAFHGPELSEMTKGELPVYRSPHQQYVFASIESPDNYPLCTNAFDGYFNWTWTYKLDSEVRWGYIVVKDSKGPIGPNQNMHWMETSKMKQISDDFKRQLRNKTKAVAWFASNCETQSGREVFVVKLRRNLQRYNLHLDVYGDCGHMQCPRHDNEMCYNMIRRDYYFYLAFENAFSEDYVTEKLLIPLQYDTVPIVFGGANYTRFLPNGSYLDARKLGVTKLTNKIIELINDPEEYAAYFKWKNYYSYHQTSELPETNEYCNICALLNNEQMMSQRSSYLNFYEWWDKAACQHERRRKYVVY